MLTSTGSFISGMVFLDANRDGIRDDNEGPFAGLVVVANSPSGEHLEAMPNEMGFYRLPAKEVGLYELRLECSWREGGRNVKVSRAAYAAI